jgi:hypothetical protein
MAPDAPQLADVLSVVFVATCGGLTSAQCG